MKKQYTMKSWLGWEDYCEQPMSVRFPATKMGTIDDKSKGFRLATQRKR